MIFYKIFVECIEINSMCIYDWIKEKRDEI